MRQLLIRLRGLIKSKRLNVFVLFFSIAFFILIITKLSRSYTDTLNFKVETINVPPEIVLLDHNTQLNVTFKAEGFKWLSYVLKTPKIIIDFKNDSLIKSKEFSFFLKDNQSKIRKYIPKNAESIVYNKDRLVFEFDVNYTKIIPVKLKSELSFENGYDVIDSLTISPKEIKLIGPKSLLDSIQFISTEPLVLTDLKTSTKANVKLDLNLYSPQITTSTKTIEVEIKVDKFTEGTLKIPIVLINKPTDKTITYFPKKTSVKFYTTLKHFNSVLETDFKIFVDYNQINKQVSYLMPQLEILNPQVKSARINLKKVDYIITE